VAEAQFCIGDHRQVKVLCDEVIALIDKRCIYHALIRSIGGQGLREEAKTLCLGVLTKLDCKFPKYGELFYVLAGVLRTEITLKTIKSIPKLPVMREELKKKCMRMICLLKHSRSTGITPVSARLMHHPYCYSLHGTS
jgi:hypothetical protein